MMMNRLRASDRPPDNQGDRYADDGCETRGGMASSIAVRGQRVMADAPPAVGGEDRGPTPVDLLAGSLGACIAFYVARYCREAGLPHEGFEVDLRLRA
jgi:uncharacterized OsmC-like protein